MPLNTTNSYASIRRSERLAKKAAYFEQSFSVPPVQSIVQTSPNCPTSSRQRVNFRRSSSTFSVTSSSASMEQKVSPRGTFGRRSVRKSIRRSLQPLANMLSSSRKRKDEKVEAIYQNRGEFVSCMLPPKNSANRGGRVILAQFVIAVSPIGSNLIGHLSAREALFYLSSDSNAPRTPRVRWPVTFQR